MEVVTPYARISDDIDGVALLRKIEKIARVSHRSEDRQTEASYERFLRFVLLTRGDWSIAEHASVTVEALIDRGITHEWVRHRLASYTQESTRFVRYEKGIKVICPPSIPTAGVVADPDSGYDKFVAWEWGMQRAEQSYLELLRLGITPQEARGALPHNLASLIYTTCNLRQWRHFFLMRTTREAHPQIREVSIPLLREFQEKIPILFEDIEPEKPQSENARMVR